MHGIIISYEKRSKQGLISGRDGSRYNFNSSQWSGRATPQEGQPVDFEVDGNQAMSIYPLEKKDADKRNKLAAALLAFFLGHFGVHRFYLGRPFSGIIYLLFCWTFIPTVLSFIEGILLLLMSEDKFDRKYNL